MLHTFLIGASGITANLPSTWSQGGVMLTARYGHAGAGTQTAGLAIGGTPNGSSALKSTEEYNKF